MWNSFHELVLVLDVLPEICGAKRCQMHAVRVAGLDRRLILAVSDRAAHWFSCADLCIEGHSTDP